MPIPYIFNTYKPPGMTSYDVVRHFKRYLPRPFGKIGHVGTLDPFAEGVLLIALGGAQRLSNLVHDWYPKVYRAVGVLGVQTATGDLTIKPCWEDSSQHFKSLSDCPVSFFQEHWEAMIGPYPQSPPSYSASKFKGKPLHAWAREGVAIMKGPVPREVYDLQVIRVDFPRVEFVTRVSSGTYIRTLFEDMAKRIKTFGALDFLCREAIGPFQRDQSLTSNQWPHEGGGWHWGPEHRVDAQFPLPKVHLEGEEARKYGHGHRLSLFRGREEEGPLWYWVLGEGGIVLGLARREREDLVPHCNFNAMR